MSDSVLKSDPFQLSTRPFLEFGKTFWHRPGQEDMLLIFCCDSRIATKLGLNNDGIEDLRSAATESFIKEHPAAVSISYFELTEDTGEFKRLDTKPEWANLF